MAALRCAKYCDPFGVDALAQIGIDQRGVDQQIDRAIELLFPPLLQAEAGVGVAARRLVFRRGHDKIQIAGVRAEVRPGGLPEEFQPQHRERAAQRRDVVAVVEDEVGDDKDDRAWASSVDLSSVLGCSKIEFQYGHLNAAGCCEVQIPMGDDCGTSTSCWPVRTTVAFGFGIHHDRGVTGLIGEIDHVGQIVGSIGMAAQCLSGVEV
jgi:hypothetical protein